MATEQWVEVDRAGSTVMLKVELTGKEKDVWDVSKLLTAQLKGVLTPDVWDFRLLTRSR